MDRLSLGEHVGENVDRDLRIARNPLPFLLTGHDYLRQHHRALPIGVELRSHNDSVETIQKQTHRINLIGPYPSDATRGVGRRWEL